jgi:hypothetical protein
MPEIDDSQRACLYPLHRATVTVRVGMVTYRQCRACGLRIKALYAFRHSFQHHPFCNLNWLKPTPGRREP